MTLLLAAASAILGLGSMAWLGWFLVRGSVSVWPPGLPEAGLLALDAALALLFIAQHSGMIRDRFRRRLAGLLPVSTHPALYGAASGLALMVMLAGWQRSAVVVWSLGGAGRLAVAAVWLAAAAWSAWAVRSLGSFDALGLDALLAGRRAGERPTPTGALIIRGPYRLVRHPLYTAALVYLWACPHCTADRLLLALLWTVWMVAGARWEERDLVERFGEPYRAYQRAVPMLAPLPRRAR